MSISSFISLLRPKLSLGAEIFCDPEDIGFQKCLERWSNVDVKVPTAIFCPSTYLDVGIIIEVASEHEIPFVAVSGGHSPWSTISSPGFILDLRMLNKITVDNENEIVKVAGAVLTNELAATLSEAGRCTTVANGNTVGVIPYCLGGGISILTAVAGYACDQITEATVALADGRIVRANENLEPDLFWAIKGSGCHFGIVLELSLKTFPLSILGSDDGSHWAGTFIYTLDRAEEVCKVLEPIMANEEYNTAGSIVLAAPPPAFQPMLVVAPRFMGDPERALSLFQPLSDLGPSMMSSSNPLFFEYQHAIDYACAKGDFKHFNLVGISDFKTANFLQVVEVYKELLSTCADAGPSSYLIQWHTSVSKPVVSESAYSHQDIFIWLNTFSWYHQAENRDLVMDFQNRAIAAIRKDQEEANYVDYASTNRGAPVERRYGGADRILKLRQLKQKWDPKGVFTREFL